jgi:hypothetical protein
MRNSCVYVCKGSLSTDSARGCRLVDVCFCPYAPTSLHPFGYGWLRVMSPRPSSIDRYLQTRFTFPACGAPYRIGRCDTGGLSALEYCELSAPCPTHPPSKREGERSPRAAADQPDLITLQLWARAKCAGAAAPQYGKQPIKITGQIARLSQPSIPIFPL